MILKQRHQVRCDPYAGSGDGSVAVGAAETEDDWVAFFWDDTNGVRNLQDVLINDNGLESSLDEWGFLSDALDVSDAGLTVVGYGYNNSNDQTEAWIARMDPATVPEPSSLILLGIALACLLGNARLRV